MQNFLTKVRFFLTNDFSMVTTTPPLPLPSRTQQIQFSRKIQPYYSELFTVHALEKKPEKFIINY